ncbi:MAG TPA: pilin [Gammaproteobacteria bacterium]|nr:pilin [Gammaproteobacteria bacterium]
MQNRNPYAAPRTNVTARDSAVAEYGEVKLFSASGRIGRVRYLAYSIGLSIIVLLVAGMMAGLAGVIGGEGAAVLVMALGYFAMLGIQFLPAIQRSHDMNVSGWLSLIQLVPFGPLVFLFAPGTRGENNYGNPPPPNGVGVILVACLLPFFFVGGVLAAIAIPAYQDYTIRAQVSEGLNIAAAIKSEVAQAYGRTGAAPADRVEAGLSADPADSAGMYVDSVDVMQGTIMITYGGNANGAIAGSVLAIRPYVMPDRSVVWRCGQGPVPVGAVAMDESATAFTVDMLPKYLPSACRP